MTNQTRSLFTDLVQISKNCLRQYNGAIVQFTQQQLFSVTFNNTNNKGVDRTKHESRQCFHCVSMTTPGLLNRKFICTTFHTLHDDFYMISTNHLERTAELCVRISSQPPNTQQEVLHLPSGLQLPTVIPSGFTVPQ